MSNNIAGVNDDREQQRTRLTMWVRKDLTLFLVQNLLPFSLLLVIVIGAWWAYALWAKSVIIPTPPDVLRALSTETPTVLTDHLWESLKRFGGGYVVGLLMGTVLGLIIASSRYVYNAFFPFMEFFRSLPATALFPFLLAALGDNDYSRTGTAVYITLWITAFNTSQAVRRVGNRRKEYLTAINARPWFVMRHLYVYELLPSFMNSARVTLPLTLLVMVAVEMIIGANAGLGKAIYNAHYYQDYAGVAAVILIVGFVGLTLNKIAQGIDKLVIFWKE